MTGRHVGEAAATPLGTRMLHVGVVLGMVDVGLILYLALAS